MKKKYLIITSNPDDLCVATECDLISSIREYGEVFSIDINKIIGVNHPTEGWRDRLYYSIDRKYSRFQKKLIGVNDITKKIRLSDNKIPDMPFSIDELRKYEKENVKIGLAALSTAASFAKCCSNYILDYRGLIERSWETAHKSFEIGKKLEKYGFHEVYIFNGRHSISRPISEYLGLSAGVKIIFYEFDSSREGYLLYEEVIHSYAYQAKLISDHNPSLDLGKYFFESNIKRLPNTDANRFTSMQKYGLIPGEIANKNTVTFFTSSPDEYFAINVKPNISDEFINQNDIALFLAEKCIEINKKFVLRLHPHLKEKHKSWLDEWDFDELKKRKAIIIYPDEPYDSYSILLNSCAIVTIGSTIGIEAAYHGVPNAVVGQAIGVIIGCSYDGSTKESLSSFIGNPVNIFESKNAAIRYGSFYLRRGKIIEGFLTDHQGISYYNGKLISYTGFVRKKLKKLLKIKSI